MSGQVANEILSESSSGKGPGTVQPTHTAMGTPIVYGRVHLPIGVSYQPGANNQVATSDNISNNNNSSGSDSLRAPLSAQQEAYLDWEANTAEGNVARDARMQNISNLISLGVPGLGIVNALQGKLPSLSAIFGTPAAYTDYQQRSQYYPTAGMTPGSAGWSQAVNEQAASRMARQEGVGDSSGDYGGGDNSNRSDPSAVGSMADTSGD